MLRSDILHLKVLKKLRHPCLQQRNDTTARFGFMRKSGIFLFVGTIHLDRVETTADREETRKCCLYHIGVLYTRRVAIVHGVPLPML